MQVQKVNKDGMTHWVLLDNDMHLMLPVCEFLEFQRKIARADNTLRAYALDLKIYFEYLDRACCSYRAVSADTVADFVEELRGEAGSKRQTARHCGRSINRILGSIYRFYHYEQMRGECKNPICKEVVRGSGRMYRGALAHTASAAAVERSVFRMKEQETDARIVSEAEFRVFLSALGSERDRLLFLLLYHTGARIREALDLTADAVPEPSDTQTIGVFTQIRSKGKCRDLYAPMFLIRALHAFAHRGAPRTLVFVTEKKNCEGRPLSYHAAYDILCRTRARVGLEFGFHDLRHTFCTRLLEQGMDIGVVSRVMGHSNLYTTKHYMHLSDDCLMAYLAGFWAAEEGGLCDEKN